MGEGYRRAEEILGVTRSLSKVAASRAALEREYGGWGLSPTGWPLDCAKSPLHTSLPTSQAGAAVAAQHPRSSQAPAARWHHRNVSFPRAGVTPQWTHASSHKRWARKPPSPESKCSTRRVQLAPSGPNLGHPPPGSGGPVAPAYEDPPREHSAPLPIWAGPPPSHPTACNCTPASNTQRLCLPALCSRLAHRHPNTLPWQFLLCFLCMRPWLDVVLTGSNI